MVIYYYYENTSKRFIRSSVRIRPDSSGFGEALFAERSGTSKLLGNKSGVEANSVEEVEWNIEAVQDTTPGDG